MDIGDPRSFFQGLFDDPSTGRAPHPPDFEIQTDGPVFLCFWSFIFRGSGGGLSQCQIFLGFGNEPHFLALLEKLGFSESSRIACPMPLYKHAKNLLAAIAAEAVGAVGRGEGEGSLAKRKAAEITGL
jgi:hypothetical protein